MSFVIGYARVITLGLVLQHSIEAALRSVEVSST